MPVLVLLSMLLLQLAAVPATSSPIAIQRANDPAVDSSELQRRDGFSISITVEDPKKSKYFQFVKSHSESHGASRNFESTMRMNGEEDFGFHILRRILSRGMSIIRHFGLLNPVGYPQGGRGYGGYGGHGGYGGRGDEDDDDDGGDSSYAPPPPPKPKTKSKTHSPHSATQTQTPTPTPTPTTTQSKKPAAVPAASSSTSAASASPSPPATVKGAVAVAPAHAEGDKIGKKVVEAAAAAAVKGLAG
ncbi:hypothetical protein DFJ73DRAFT_781269 [Zopfochytrium polystomum]|nr:hypothetical protein DFJ73DRAFT_781269 [Zopfochytrium polystomum]